VLNAAFGTWREYASEQSRQERCCVYAYVCKRQRGFASDRERKCILCACLHALRILWTPDKQRVGGWAIACLRHNILPSK
jgi:hypothetical protein